MHAPVKKFKNHRVNRSAVVGTAERTILLQKRSLELHARGYYLRDIAEELQKEFGLERVPSVPSVHAYLQAQKAEFLADIKALQKAIRIEQYNEVEETKRKYYKIAMEPCICTRTTVKQDGEAFDIIHEDDFDRQIDALNGYLKCCQRQASLLGLDLKEARDEQGNVMSPQDFHLWIINHVTKAEEKPAQAHEVDGRPVLELRAGNEADEL